MQLEREQGIMHSVYKLCYKLWRDIVVIFMPLHVISPTIYELLFRLNGDLILHKLAIESALLEANHPHGIINKTKLQKDLQYTYESPKRNLLY